MVHGSHAISEGLLGKSATNVPYKNNRAAEFEVAHLLPHAEAHRTFIFVHKALSKPATYRIPQKFVRINLTPIKELDAPDLPFSDKCHREKQAGAATLIPWVPVTVD